MSDKYQELSILEFGKTDRHSCRPKHFINISDLEKFLEEGKELGANSVGVYLEEYDLRYGTNNFKIVMETSRQKSTVELLEQERDEVSAKLSDIESRLEEARKGL